VLVSATGECTPVNDDGDSIHGDDANDFSMGIDEVTEQHRIRSLPHLSFGKLTGSFEDKVVDAFMWLRRQTKGKQIYATKVTHKPQIHPPTLVNHLNFGHNLNKKSSKIRSQSE
jgi:hypothetical protein